MPDFDIIDTRCNIIMTTSAHFIDMQYKYVGMEHIYVDMRLIIRSAFEFIYHHARYLC